MSTVGIMAIAVAATSFACAQTASRGGFEVASIHPAEPSTAPRVGWAFHIDGAQVRTSNITVRDWVGFAYQINAARVFGPDWIGSDRFDITATIPAGSRPEQVREMFQTLLENRFQLKLHHEKREFPIYALVTNKGPLKLKEAPQGDTPAGGIEPVNVAASVSAGGVSLELGNGSSWSLVPNRFEARKLSMPALASALERFADRTIIDMTGLQGEYDFVFDLNPDDYRLMRIRGSVTAGVSQPPEVLRMLEGSSSLSISDGLGKIGLRLEARKTSLDVIVIDGGRKTPTEN